MDQVQSPVSPQGTIEADVSCLKCGYNLRGLAASSACPECGLAVQASIRDRMLQFSNPEWIGKVAMGLKIIIGAIVASFVFVFVSIALGLMIQSQIASIALMLIFVLGMMVAYCIAIWLVTTPEPSPPTQDHEKKRELSRWFILAGYLAWPITTGLQAAGLVIVSGLVSFVTGIMGIAGFVMLMLYLRTLALRVPDEKLAKHTVIVLIGLGVSYGFIILGGLVSLISTAGGNTGGGGPGAAAQGALIGGAGLVCIAGPFILVFGLWQLLVIDKYRRVMSQAAEQARGNMARFR